MNIDVKNFFAQYDFSGVVLMSDEELFCFTDDLAIKFSNHFGTNDLSQFWDAVDVIPEMCRVRIFPGRLFAAGVDRGSVSVDLGIIFPNDDVMD